jgi:energy-coupling factor transporter transmembrane protein EcfT
MIVFTMAAGFANKTFDLVALTSVLIIVYITAGLSVKNFINEIRYFLILIGIIMIAHSFTIPGTAITGLPIRGMTWEGLSSGVFFGWRLILMILIGTIMTGTTSLSLLKNVIEWFLRPIPFIPEARVATMFSLTFVLIPLVFDQASEMLEAQKSRCIDERKNLINRILFLAGPLLFHTFMRVDEIVQAMESRCYSEVHTKTIFKTTLKDWVLLSCSVFVCFSIFYRIIF